MRVKITVVLGILLIVMAGGYGVSKRHTYTNLTGGEIPMENVVVYLFTDDFAKALDMEKMAKNMENEAAFIFRVRAESVSYFVEKTRCQDAELLWCYKGNAPEDKDISIAFGPTFLTEHRSVNLNFVNEMRPGQEYLVFCDGIVKSEENREFYTMVGTLIMPCFALGEGKSAVVRADCDSETGTLPAASYGGYRDNEFFAESEMALQALENLKAIVTGKFVGTEGSFGMESETDMGEENAVVATSNLYTANLYKYEKDEKTGKEKYGLLLGEDFVYTGEELFMGAGLRVESTVSNEEIPFLCMLFVEGNPIPFSFDGDEYERFHEVVIPRGEEKIAKIGLSPEGISKGEKNLLFVAVPFWGKSLNQIDENEVAYRNRKIIFSCGDADGDGEKLVYDEDYDRIDLEEMLRIQKEAKEQAGISPEEKKGILMNFLYEDGDGNYYFASDQAADSIKTMLFCDGRPYAGFACGESFWWEGKGQRIRKKLSLEKLPPGKHVLFVMTIENDEDIFFSVYKTLNLEVEIDE